MLRTVLTGAAVLLVLVACSPTVKVAPPDEPITINLNVDGPVKTSTAISA